jgi:DNA-binding GntR family transcriptional regulator
MTMRQKKDTERRNLRERGAIVRRVIEDVIANPSVTLTVDTMQAWLNVPNGAAQRILARLASSGLVREIQHGIFVRGVLPGELS